MKNITCVPFLLAAALSPAALAQTWEVGVGGGGSFFPSQTVNNPAGNATAGFNNGLAVSAWLGNNSGRKLGGELRYDYEKADLALSSGGTKATFAGRTNAIHYDFLLHLASDEASVRPFLAAGGGVKVYSGTGTESAVQPLSNIAFLTKTSETTALFSLGAGVKFNISRIAQLRLDMHDYMTPFPKNVIAPAAGSKVSGWVQDFVVMAGLSFTL